jgi:stearoyl-CoA desaturase (delta-9 desaturase)
MPHFGSWAGTWWRPVLFAIIAGHITKTKEWVACHRKHHAFADREGDPHSPLMEGLRNIVLMGAFYYRKAVQMLWIPFWAAGIVNGVGHAFGYRNHAVKDASRNITPFAIWLGGEELHNNHHADPKSATFSHRWFEVDIGWMYIQLLSALGLARVEYARER